GRGQCTALGVDGVARRHPDRAGGHRLVPRLAGDARRHGGLAGQRRGGGGDYPPRTGPRGPRGAPLRPPPATPPSPPHLRRPPPLAPALPLEAPAPVPDPGAAARGSRPPPARDGDRPRRR